VRSLVVGRRTRDHHRGPPGKRKRDPAGDAHRCVPSLGAVRGANLVDRTAQTGSRRNMLSTHTTISSPILDSARSCDSDGDAKGTELLQDCLLPEGRGVVPTKEAAPIGHTRAPSARAWASRSSLDVTTARYSAAISACGWRRPRRCVPVQHHLGSVGQRLRVAPGLVQEPRTVVARDRRVLCVRLPCVRRSTCHAGST
jgi:hypothetical protein